MKELLKTQVLVIGSGAGGAITAAKLAEAGFQVLIVEEGGGVDKSGIPTHSPEAMRRWYRNNGLSPILGNVRIAFVEGRCVGGGTEINSAFWHRSMPQAIERWRENYAIRDLTVAGLDALYPEIEKELNVSACEPEAIAPQLGIAAPGPGKAEMGIHGSAAGAEHHRPGQPFRARRQAFHVADLHSPRLAGGSRIAGQLPDRAHLPRRQKSEPRVGRGHGRRRSKKRN